jgi:antitoxin HigA-1
VRAVDHHYYALPLKQKAHRARTPIHPGEHLAEELRELGISAAKLARQIDAPVNHVTGIINGQRSVTANTAPAPNFGSIFRCSTSCSWRGTEVGDRVKKLPRRIDRKLKTKDESAYPP